MIFSLLFSSLVFAQTPEEMFNSIKAQKDTKTIAEAIGTLPETVRKNHVLVFQSRSLQEASYQNPRTFLFNEDASLIVTFNGSREQRGFESMEVIRFIQKDARFVMEEIVFKKDLESRKQFLREQQDEIALEQIDNRQNRSGENAPMCLACHRQDPRPIWEAYPIWPGVYGQNDGKFGIMPHANMNGSELMPMDVEKELDEFTKFEKSSSTHPRFSKLVDLNKHYTVKRGEYSINTQFNRLLANLNNQKIVRMFLQHPDYENFKPKLLSSLYPPPGSAYVPVYRDNVAFYEMLEGILPKNLHPSFLSMSNSPRPEANSFMTPDNFTEELFLIWKMQDPKIEKPGRNQ